MRHKPPKVNLIWDVKTTKAVHMLFKLITNKQSGVLLNHIFEADGKLNYHELREKVVDAYATLHDYKQAIMKLRRNHLVLTKGIGKNKRFVINEATRDNIRLFLSEVKVGL